MYQPTGQGNWNRPQLYATQPENLPQQYAPRGHAPVPSYGQRPGGMYPYHDGNSVMKPMEMQLHTAPNVRSHGPWDTSQQGMTSQYPSFDQRKMYPDYQKSYNQPDYTSRYPSMATMNVNRQHAAPNAVNEDPSQRHLQRNVMPGISYRISYLRSSISRPTSLILNISFYRRKICSRLQQNAQFSHTNELSDPPTPTKSSFVFSLSSGPKPQICGAVQRNCSATASANDAVSKLIFTQ